MTDQIKKSYEDLMGVLGTAEIDVEAIREISPQQVEGGMVDLAARQQEILEAVVVPSLSYRSKEQQEKDLLRQELEEDLREMEMAAAQDRRTAR